MGGLIEKKLKTFGSLTKSTDLKKINRSTFFLKIWIYKKQIDLEKNISIYKNSYILGDSPSQHRVVTDSLIKQSIHTVYKFQVSKQFYTTF